MWLLEIDLGGLKQQQLRLFLTGGHPALPDGEQWGGSSQRFSSWFSTGYCYDICECIVWVGQEISTQTPVGVPEKFGCKQNNLSKLKLQAFIFRILREYIVILRISIYEFKVTLTHQLSESQIPQKEEPKIFLQCMQYLHAYCVLIRFQSDK